ncbi:MAG: hypothetical protein KKA73_07335 [Chloroflexi bacterium]|nr:hypothetical protein [Chloroflexota bacterium]MBU1747484.1 hypothetical protein [Chloroflexota bacterium]
MNHTCRRFLFGCVLLAGLLALAGCGSSQPFVLTDAFPASDALPGWTITDPVRTFDRENLYDLVDGQADAFFAYGFEQVAVQGYENAAGVILRVTIWQVATPADAYGLFATSASGTPVAIGNDGDSDPGRRIIYWQDRYYVQVNARPELLDAELQAWAQAVAPRLPTGGKRPALVDRLPATDRVANSTRFFHLELSIQDEVWLGGENVLGLSATTDGTLARYIIGGATGRLLLVQYPTAEAATAALSALQGVPDSGLVTARTRDNLLGAVFGEIDESAANALLTAALGGK